MTMTIRGARLLALLALFGALLFSGNPARMEVAACTPVLPTINGFVVPNAPPTCTEDATDPVVSDDDEDDPDMPADPEDGDGDEG